MNDFKEGVQFVHAFVITRQGRSQIESKSVDMHLENPIAQAVHHQLQRAWMQQVKGVARAGEIQIETRIIGLQSVISGIIDAAEAQRRPELIPFRGVIVNHVENYFDTGGMEAAHHRFELRDLFTHLPTARIRRVWREKSDRVVTPVIL